MLVSKHPLYNLYTTAKSRCNNPNHTQYKDYGGRGIKFLFKNFEDFLNAVGDRPNGLTLNRINNDGNYEHGNVEWTTYSNQALNQRKKKTNKSGVTGVYFCNTRQIWVASKQINNKRRNLYQGPHYEKAVKAINEYNALIAFAELKSD